MGGHAQRVVPSVVELPEGIRIGRSAALLQQMGKASEIKLGTADSRESRAGGFERDPRVIDIDDFHGNPSVLFRYQVTRCWVQPKPR